MTQLISNEAPFLKGRLSITDAAQLIGVTRPTVLRWVKSKQIPAVMVGKRWYVTRQDLDNFIKKN